MIRPTASITGDKELDRLLRDLGDKALKDSVIKRGLKEIAKPIIADIRSNIHDVSKNLSRSVGVLRKIKSKKGRPFIMIGPRYYGNFKGYHAHLVEVGSKVYDVEYEAQHNIERAYNKNKTQALNKLNSVIMKQLNKKLKKLQG